MVMFEILLQCDFLYSSVYINCPSINATVLNADSASLIFKNEYIYGGIAFSFRLFRVKNYRFDRELIIVYRGMNSS